MPPRRTRTVNNKLVMSTAAGKVVCMPGGGLLCFGRPHHQITELLAGCTPLTGDDDCQEHLSFAATSRQ